MRSLFLLTTAAFSPLIRATTSRPGGTTPGQGQSRRSSREQSLAERLYWLSNCRGFRVDAPEGRLGFVERVGFGDDQERPEVLVVRAGLFGKRSLIVSVDAVQEVSPQGERILLRGSPGILGTEWLGP